MFSPDPRRVLKDLTYVAQVNCVLLGNGQYRKFYPFSKAAGTEACHSLTLLRMCGHLLTR
jgi:hypothetical protein